jgi:predicted transcriptional regulator of viral defense system
MGKQIHLKKIERLFEKSPVVDFRSIERLVGNKTKTSNYAKLLVSNLLKKKKIYRLGKGTYTKHNENYLAVFGFKPAYLGLQSALSYYGLWEQETIPVILTTKKVRTGLRNSLDGNILIKHISSKHFFGYNYLKDGAFFFPYSDLEKTLIDLVVFKQKIDPDTLKKFKKEVDKNRLKQYLKRYDFRTRKKILGLI